MGFDFRAKDVMVSVPKFQGCVVSVLVNCTQEVALGLNVQGTGFSEGTLIVRSRGFVAKDAESLGVAS